MNGQPGIPNYMTKSKTERTSSLLKPLDLIRNRFSSRNSTQGVDSYHFLLDPFQAKEVNTPAGFERGIINTPNGKVNYYQTGKGPTIVFVHGWGGGSYQFFALMRGLKECGFTAVAFDHLPHGTVAQRPATLKQMINTTDAVLQFVRDKHLDGLLAVVAHDIGCMILSNSKNVLIDGLPLFMIAPVFDFKSYFIKRMQRLKLRSERLNHHISSFSADYEKNYSSLELARNLKQYSDDTVIAHDKNDEWSAISDTVKFCAKHPLTKLVVTQKWGHERIINAESVWHELKSMINYEDTTVNFSNIVRDQNS